MPNCCSVPNCKSNYPGSKNTYTVFTLPKDAELAKMWLKQICRENVSELQTIFVCIRHFREEDLLLTIDIPQPDGTLKTVSRRPTYLPGSFPRIFEFRTYSQINDTIPQRLDLDKKEKSFFHQGITDSKRDYELELERFSVSTFEEFKLKISNYTLPENWFLWYSSDTTLSIFKPRLSGSLLNVESYILIDSSLCAKGFYEDVQVALSVHHIKDVREIDSSINDISSYHQDDSQKEIKQAIVNLQSSIDNFEFNHESDTLLTIPRLQFILCQLANILLPKQKYRYNVITLTLALKAQLISPACYSFLQTSLCLTLPHQSTLRNLTSKSGLEYEFKEFLIKSTAKFTKQQRQLVLNIDEVYVQSDFSYKGGKIYGSSSSNVEVAAKTVLAFMVTSLFEKWSEIVRLYPLASTDAKEVFEMVTTVITDIEKCNLNVVVLCTDNLPLNQSLFKLLSRKHVIEQSVPHPYDPNRPLFLIFDFVHIIKCIRNNWLNQHDAQCSFIFPSFEDTINSNLPASVSRASFEDIRNQYRLEHSSTLKQAYKLTAKVCWPTNLERQNVNLALAVFSESTNATLSLNKQLQGAAIVTQTHEFLDVIVRIWKIFNVNSPMKGKRLRDSFSNPLINNDERYCFLDKVVQWLDTWKLLPGKVGKLTPQTFSSFRHSCLVLPQIVNYLTSETCGFAYILSSRLQNDPLEHRFGVYRQMSGAQYNISVLQILESERRLKLSSILKLFQKETAREMSLKDFIKTFTSEEEPVEITPLEDFLFLLDNSNLLPEVDETTLLALAFVAGYAIHSTYSKYKDRCGECFASLTKQRDIHLEDQDNVNQLIQITDRGGLKYPAVEVLESCILLWKIFTAIEVQPILFSKFVASTPRKILISLSTIKIEDTSSLTEFWRSKCDNCLKVKWDILKKILCTISNCILANKVRNLNSLKVLKSSKRTSNIEDNRKLKKFQS